MTPYILHRDARLIELDLITFCEIEHNPEDYRPLLKRFSDRIGRLADTLQRLDVLQEATIKAADRWMLLYETQGVSFRSSTRNAQLQFDIFRETASGSKLIGSGRTLTEAADKALGFN